MIRLTVISASMPNVYGIEESRQWTRTGRGLTPTYSKMVKFDRYYGRLDASKSYAQAWEAMTLSARRECLTNLVPNQWLSEAAAEAEAEAHCFSKLAERVFTNPDTIGGKAEMPKPVAPAEWNCVCGAKNSGKFCPKCGTAAPKPEPPKPQWICECGASNDADSVFCENCGKKRPEPPAEPEKKLSEMTAAELFALFGKMAAEEEAAAKAAAAKAPTETIVVPPEDQKPVSDGQNRGSDGKFTKKDKK